MGPAFTDNPSIQMRQRNTGKKVIVVRRRTKEEVWDDVAKINFENAAFNPNKWVLKAVDLLKTAKTLEPDLIKLWRRVDSTIDSDSFSAPDNYSHEPYFMLMSFSIENLLKAKIIENNGLKYKMGFRGSFDSGSALKKKKDQLFPKELKSHELYGLAGKAGLQMDFDDEALLRRLSLHATWAGRYPVPLKYQELSMVVVFESGEKHSLNFLGSGDIETVTRFVNGLPARLGLYIPHVWPINSPDNS